MTTALVLVDLQADFLASPGLVPCADEVVAGAAELLAAWRARGLPIVHVRMGFDPGDDRRMPHWRAEGLWRCVEGTPGAEPPTALAPRSGEARVTKTTFDPFVSGALAPALAEVGADRVVLAGVNEHACVRATALGAYERGLEVVVAEDAVGSDDPLHAAASRRWLEGRAARHLSVAQIVKSLDEAPRDGSGSAHGPVLAAARRAQRAWSALPPEERRAALVRVAEALAQDHAALARVIVDEVGKPITLARAEVDRAIALVRVAADEALRAGDAARDPGSRTRWRPHGVVLAVTPWNNPLALPVGKLAPALAFGNAVVLKPSPKAEACATRLAAALARAGLPHGLVTVVSGDGAVARALASHPGIDAVSVTGSLAAGVAMQALCARRFTPLQAELGGNNAAIVWPPVDVGRAASAIALGAFGFAGQRCTANRRIVVPRGDLDAWVDALAAAALALHVGDADDPETVVGPLVDAPAAERVRGVIARAAADGLRVVARASVPDEPCGPRFVAPTIVVAPDPAHPIVQVETFGPVLVVQPADDPEHALALLDGVPQGLAAALFGGTPDLRARFLAEARAGILKLDQATSDAGVTAPFGGWKASGVGPPEHGPHDRDFYARAQAVYEEAT